MAKFFLAAIVIIILAGAGFWYWTCTPQYSMMKLAEAIHKHDGETFRTYFDVDSVSKHAVDDLSSNGVQEIGGAGLLQRLVGRTVGGLFKPELAQMLGKKIIDYVEKDPNKPSESGTAGAGESSDSPTSQEPAQEPQEAPRERPGLLGRAVGGFFKKIGEFIKFPSLRDVLQEMGISKPNYRGLTPFETNGTLCHVSLKFQPPDKEEVLVQLELENADNHWHVVRFSNLDSIAKAVSGI